MPSKPILFSIDPGSRVAGIAVFEGSTLLDWSLLKVPASRDPVDRCLMMCSAVEAIIDGVLEKTEGDRTVTIVVELPGGQNRPYARGLVTLGMAVGMIVAYLTALGHRVVTILASKWTRLNSPRCLSKAVRAKYIEEMYPYTYDRSKDKSLDGADAIGLGAYFLGLFDNKEE